jgi:CHAD domain-containing protein
VLTDDLAEVRIGDAVQVTDGAAGSPRASDPPIPLPGVGLRLVGPGDDDAPRGSDVTLHVVERLAVARSPEVSADDPWAEAGRKVVRFHLARMLTNVPSAIVGTDPEGVHDLRVTTRRVRAAWRVFGDAYDRAVVRTHAREMRTLGAQLGAVRDLDVQLAIVSAYRERRSKRERAALAPLVDAWTAERRSRHDELATHLASPWFGAVVASQEAFVTTERAGVRSLDPVVSATVRTMAPSVAWKAYGSVWAFEPVVNAADVATLHELRIAAKWLRYTLEFVREPMEPAATELIRRVVTLQDQLGDIHDLHAAAVLARETAGAASDLRPAQRTAVERFAASQDARVERIRRRIGPAWRGVSDAEYRRLLGRSLAHL